MTQPPPGWWLASDGNWYPPPAAAAPATAYPASAAYAAVPAPRRRHRWWWVLAAVAAVVVLLGVASVFVKSDDPLTAKLGQHLTLHGQPHEQADVSVVRVIDPATQTAQFGPNTFGDRYLGVVVQVHNTGTIDIPDAEIDGDINDSVSQSPVGLQNCPVLTGSIKPGQTHTECNSFELPPGVQLHDYALELNYDGAREGRWTVS